MPLLFSGSPDQSVTANESTKTANDGKKQKQSREERLHVQTKTLPDMLRIYLRSEGDLTHYTDTVMHRSTSMGEVALFACRQPWWPGQRVDPHELILKIFLTQGDGKHLELDLRKEMPRSILSHWCTPQHTLEQIIAEFDLAATLAHVGTSPFP